MRPPDINKVSLPNFPTVHQAQLEVLRQIAKSLANIEHSLEVVNAHLQKTEKKLPSV